MRIESLKPTQTMTIVASTVLGVNILTAHHDVISLAKQDAWIALLLGGVLTFAAGSAIYALANLYPQKDLPEIILSIGGGVFGRILLVPLILYTLVYPATSLRVFAQVVRVFLLDRTPLAAIIILTCLVSAYIAAKDIYSIGGVIDSLFPVFTITLVVYIFLALIQGDLNYIKPILFDNTSNVIRAVAPSYKAFVGYGAIAYILCYTKPLKGTYKWFAFGMAIPVIFTTAAGLAVLLNFGPEEVVTIVYPFLTLSKSIEFPTTLIERLESFSVIIWIPAVVSTVIMYTYVSIRNFTVLLNISPKQKKYIVYAHIPVMTFIALIYRDSLEVIRYFHLVDTLAAILGLGVVPVFTLIAFIKRRRKME